MGLPKALQDVDSVIEAVKEASDYAMSKGIPMTIERLAYTLGMTTSELSKAANGHKFDLDSGDNVTQEIAHALKMAVQLSATELFEHGLIKGNNPLMPMFGLKCNHGYNDHPEPINNNNVVVFIGGDNIPD